MRRRRLFIVVVALLSTIVATAATLERLDRKGRRFFETGKRIVTSLDNMASAVRARDVNAIKDFYSSGYSGGCLGIAEVLESGRERDGIIRQTITASELTCDRQAALD